MEKTVRFRVNSGVAAVILNNPPLNIITHDMRCQLQVIFKKISKNASVKCVVIFAEGADFSAGADIAEYAQKPQNPTLGDICNQIENCQHPVVACLQGRVLGGGLEIALAAHARVAVENVELGLPEIELGLLPGAGGTQRLPRLVGAELALQMMLSGKTITQEKARSSGLIQGAIDGHLVTGGVTFARAVADRDEPLTPTSKNRTRFADMDQYLAAVKTARGRVNGPAQMAHRKIVECIEAAPLLPFETGLVFETTAFGDCRTSSVSQALRHMFFASRASGHDFDLPDSVTPVVVGGSTRAISFAAAVLRGGYPLRLLVETDAQVGSAKGSLQRYFESLVSAGKMTQDAAQTAVSRVKLDTSGAAFAEGDLWIIAEENPSEPVMDWVDDVMDALPENVAVATMLPILDGAPAVDHAASVLFDAEPHKARVAQIMPADGTVGDAENRMARVLSDIGVSSVQTKLQNISLRDRINAAYFLAADTLLRKGVKCAAIDAAMTQFGMPFGPCLTMDRFGLAQVLKWRREVFPEALVSVAADLNNKGCSGAADGIGFYNHDATPLRVSDEVTDTLQQIGDGRDVVLNPATLQRLCVGAMAAEGARLVDRGIVKRPADIDAVMVRSGAFPRHKGGPMKAADIMGLLPLRTLLSKIDGPQDLWQVNALWDQAVKTADGFSLFND